jgi:hypothetical protein
MSFFTRIRKFNNNNNIFRYSHHHHYPEAYYLSQQERDIRSLLGEQEVVNTTQKIIINLLGEQNSVDKASWEIKSFAKEKSLNTANIVFDNEILRILLCKNNFLQFIVNRCYNMPCNKVLLFNDATVNRTDWKPYNLYVIPDATNRFTTCKFIQKCDRANFIIYPLAASEEIKRRDIKILFD